MPRRDGDRPGQGFAPVFPMFEAVLDALDGLIDTCARGGTGEQVSALQVRLAVLDSATRLCESRQIA